MKALRYSDDPLYTNCIVRDDSGKLVAIVENELLARRLCFADRVCEELFAMLKWVGDSYENKERAVKELTKIGYFEDEEDGE